jgi:hypothetical protein
LRCTEQAKAIRHIVGLVQQRRVRITTSRWSASARGPAKPCSCAVELLDNAECSLLMVVCGAGRSGL